MRAIPLLLMAMMLAPGCVSDNLPAPVTLEELEAWTDRQVYDAMNAYVQSRADDDLWPKTTPEHLQFVQLVRAQQAKRSYEAGALTEAQAIGMALGEPTLGMPSWALVFTWGPADFVPDRESSPYGSVERWIYHRRSYLFRHVRGEA